LDRETISARKGKKRNRGKRKESHKGREKERGEEGKEKAVQISCPNRIVELARLAREKKKRKGGGES